MTIDEVCSIAQTVVWASGVIWMIVMFTAHEIWKERNGK